MHKVIGVVCHTCKEAISLDGARVEDGKFFHDPRKKNCYEVYLKEKERKKRNLMWV